MHRFSLHSHDAGNSCPDPALVSRFFQLVNSEQQLFSIKDARHMTKPISQNAIGRALGLSPPAMTKMRKAGCPMDSVESVRAWRTRHMNPAHMKPEPAPDPGAPQLAHAQRCMAACAQALAAGVCIKVFAPVLRPALAAVPPRLRDRVGLDLEVMRVLLAPVLPLLVPQDATDRSEERRGGKDCR